MAVLKDIGDSLKKFLHRITPELESENSIVFDSPADLESTGNNTLSVFLYQVIENSYLRNAEPEPVDIDQMRHPPLTIDLHYILTPYAKKIETELIIMEKLMQLFHDNSVLKGDMLEGGLQGSGEQIRIVPNNLTLDEINKLWERFPNKSYKLSVSYILTPVKIPSARPTEIVKRILERDIELYRKV
jgi:hypothetical protein